MNRYSVPLIAVASIVCIAVALWAMRGQGPGEQGSGGPGSKLPVVPPLTKAGGVSIQIDSDTTRIVREAEAGKIVPQMQVFEDTAASGGKYVMAPEAAGESLATAGQVEFALDIPQAAKYNVWLRVEFDDSCDNSLDVGFDAGERIEVTNNNYKVWQWIKAGRLPFDLKAGPVTLIVGNRENGTRFDEVLLTPDMDYVPVAIEATR